MARLPYISREELPAGQQHVYDRIAETWGSFEPPGRVPRTFQLLLNSPGAAEALVGLVRYLRRDSALEPVAREIAILAAAREAKSQYVWAHHERIARQVGVRDEVIEAIRSGRAPMGLPPKEGVFAQAAKEMVGKGAVSERTFQALLHLMRPQGAVDLIVVIGFYSMLARIMASLGIELEAGVQPGLPLQE